MTRPLRITYPGGFYPVTSRGNERKDVFDEVKSVFGKQAALGRNVKENIAILSHQMYIQCRYNLRA